MASSKAADSIRRRSPSFDGDFGLEDLFQEQKLGEENDEDDEIDEEDDEDDKIDEEDDEDDEIFPTCIYSQKFEEEDDEEEEEGEEEDEEDDEIYSTCIYSQKLEEEDDEEEEEDEEEDDEEDEFHLDYIDALLEYGEAEMKAWEEERPKREAEARLRREAAKQKREAEKQKREEKREEEKRNREAKKQMQAEERKREEEEDARRKEKHRSVINQIHEYDPKKKLVVYTRFHYENFSTFDLDEESDIPPMRYTDRRDATAWSANIFSVKIVTSDVGFPIHVYGSVIARDKIDYKCIHLFNRDRRDSQLINSEDESLILVGPARGMILLDYIFLEVNLKIKGEGGQDKQFSKELISIDRRVLTLDKNIERKVKNLICDSWCSTVKVEYAVVREAVEATVEFQVLHGVFDGKITVCTSILNENIVLHDSETDDVVTSASGIIQPKRRVIAVCWRHTLLFNIATTTVGRSIVFTPFVSADDYDFYVGSVKLRINVTWSVIHL